MSISIETLALARKAGPVIANAVDDWLEAHPEATTTVQDGAISRDKLDPTLVSQIENMIAPQYSSSTKYAVGDFVVKDGVLYQCTSAITAAENWDGTHWKSAIGGARNLQRAIVGFEAASGATGNQWLTFRSGGWSTSTTNHVGETAKFSASSTQVSAIAPCSPGDKFTVCLEGPTGVSRGYFFCDANMTVLSRCTTNVSYNGTVLTAPANAAYILLNNLLSRRQSGYYAYKGTALKTRVAGLESDIDRIDVALGQVDGDISRIDSAIDRIDAKDATQDERLTALERGGGGSGGSGLPAVTSEDNGKVLGVEDGEWGVVEQDTWYKEVPAPTVLFDADLTIQEDQEFGIYAGIPIDAVDSQITADTVFITVDYGETYEFDKQESGYDDTVFYGYDSAELSLMNGHYHLNAYSYPLFDEFYNVVFFNYHVGWNSGDVCHITIASKDTSTAHVPNDELEAAIKSMRGYELNHDAAVTVFEGDLEGNEHEGIYNCSFEPESFDSKEALVTVDNKTYKLPRTTLCWHYGEVDTSDWSYDFTNYPVYISIYPNAYSFYFETAGEHHLTVVDSETSFVVFDGDVLAESENGYGAAHVGDVDTSMMCFDTLHVTVDNGETYNMDVVLEEYAYGDVNSDGNAVLTRYPVQIYMAPLDEEYYINFSSGGVHHVTVKAAGQTVMETSDEFKAAVNEVLSDGLTVGSNGITIGNTTITEAELQALLALLSQDSL